MTSPQQVIPLLEYTTVNKMNDLNKMPTAQSGTFVCPYTRVTASQANESDFLPIV